MKKKMFCLLTLSIFVLLSGAIAASAATINVPGDYPTIQQAIDNATDGDTILVAAGTYVEQLEIDKGVTIEGAGADLTTIESPASLDVKFVTSADNRPIVYIHGVNDVVIKNLAIDGAGKGNGNYRFEGVAFVDAGGKLQNLEIKGIKETPLSGAQHGVAVYVWDSAGTDRTVVIENCTIYDYQKNGMALNGANLYAIVMNSTVTGSGPTSLIAQNGIQLGWGATGVVDGNTVSGNWYTGGGWASTGGLVYQSDDVVVTNNIFNNNLYGVLLVGKNATIADNAFNNNDVGIGLYPDSDAYIYGSSFSGNAEDIMWAAEVAGTDHFFGAIQNAINNAASGGTVVVYSGTYEGNIVINKPLTLKAASTPVIDGMQAGPVITISADGVTIEGLEIINGTYGISSGGTNNSVIKNNKIHDSADLTGYQGVGILFWTGTDGVAFSGNSILNNEIYNNDRQGVFLGSMAANPGLSKANTIAGNKIYSNGAKGFDQYGIQLSYADENTIRDNEIYRHDDWNFAQGIYLMASYGNLIKGNDVHNNKYGITQWNWVRAAATATESNVIRCNKIHDNDEGVRNFDAADFPAIIAKHNWWGDASGPGGSGPGSGDSVTGYVEYDPWLKVPDEVCPPPESIPEFSPIAVGVVGLLGSVVLVLSRRKF